MTLVWRWDSFQLLWNLRISGTQQSFQQLWRLNRS